MGIDHLMSYLENYGSLAVLIFLRSQAEVQESNKEQKKRRENPNMKFPASGDMSALSFINLSNDYIKFIQRLLSFYAYNFKQTVNANNCQFVSTLKHGYESRKRLDKLIKKVIPSCKDLKKILKEKRKSRNHDTRNKFNDHEFPYDDENIIYIVIVKLL